MTRLETLEMKIRECQINIDSYPDKLKQYQEWDKTEKYLNEKHWKLMIKLLNEHYDKAKLEIVEHNKRLDIEKAKVLESNMLCIWCNKQFTPKMELEFDESCDSDTFGMVSHCVESTEITITCEHCKKVCYKKEV